MDMIRPDVQEQIVRILGQLETYLKSANRVDWISCLSIIASLFISSVAICISIKTARKQNMIALFEKRYNLYVESVKYFQQ